MVSSIKIRKRGSISCILRLLLITNPEFTKQSDDPESISSLKIPDINCKQRSTISAFAVESVAVSNQGPKSQVFFRQLIPWELEQLPPHFLAPQTI